MSGANKPSAHRIRPTMAKNKPEGTRRSNMSNTSVTVSSSGLRVHGRELFRIGARRLHELSDFRDDVFILRRHIVLFGGIATQIEQFNRTAARAHAHSLPIL